MAISSTHIIAIISTDQPNDQPEVGFYFPRRRFVILHSRTSFKLFVEWKLEEVGVPSRGTGPI